MQVVCIIQARLGSVRLPNKALLPLKDRPALEWVIAQVGASKSVSATIVAIPESHESDALADWCALNGVECFRGSEDDVLSRMHDAAEQRKADLVVRVTGDCPLVDPGIIDELVDAVAVQGFEYARCSNEIPDGLGAEAMTMKCLKETNDSALDRQDREHVTTYLKRHSNLTKVIGASEDLGHIRLTLDEGADYEQLQLVVSSLTSAPIRFRDIAQLAHLQPELFSVNRHIRRDEGAAMSTGEKLWKRAQTVIPGGSMLFSKRSEIQLNFGWPAYFSRTEGCRVWDLDEREFLDFGLMGVGTNILGYSYPRVDAAVAEVVRKGNLSSLNAPEEVFLAEALIDLHPWAQQVRFARTGGEACAIAVRLARAAANRDKVAFCGYHGWHDWYLAANIDEGASLDGHLLPGLDPSGVPKGLAGSSHPFEFNDLPSLLAVLDENPDTGVIFMEVARRSEPDLDFLRGVRQLADERQIILVFDECTSGFRSVMGGNHLKYGVNPDLVVLGKTLGNGYAVTAVVGTRDVMSESLTSFISSTFWTERIGSAAGLATLAAMKEEDAPNRISTLGRSIGESWKSLGSQYGLEIHVSGISALPRFAISGFDDQLVKTYVTQEMLKRGFLASTACYVSIAHEGDPLSRYYEALDTVFAQISACHSDADLRSKIEHGVVIPGFTRLA